MTNPSPDAHEPPALDSTYRQLIETVARGWWDALDTDREMDWADIVDLCMYISDATPPAETDFETWWKTSHGFDRGHYDIAKEAWQVSQSTLAARLKAMEDERDAAVRIGQKLYDKLESAEQRVADTQRDYAQLLDRAVTANKAHSATLTRAEAAEQSLTTAEYMRRYEVDELAKRLADTQARLEEAEEVVAWLCLHEHKKPNVILGSRSVDISARHAARAKAKDKKDD